MIEESMMSKADVVDLEQKINTLEAELAAIKNRDQEQVLRSIFKAAPTGIGMVINRVIAQANDRLCEMTGYSVEELIGRSARILYPTDEDFDYVGREKYRQIAEHGTGTVETHWQRKGGEIIEVLLSSTPLNIEDLSAGVTFTALDITERKRIEAELRRSEQRFRAMAELLPQTVFEMEPNGRLTFVNESALKVFGYTQQDFEKEVNALDMIAPQDRDLARIAIHAVLQGSTGAVGRRYNAIRKDGQTFPVLVYSSPRTDENGVIGLRGIIVDISEQEKLIQERDKLQEQYIQAQKMEAVGRLSGGVAHDLNNMLAPIVGYGELLLEAMPSDAPNREAIEEILSAGLRARDMVRQLLAFSRKQALEIKSIDLNQVLKGFQSLLNRILRDDIHLEWDLKPNIPSILADTGQIEQVLMNLAVNAQDAMPDGGTVRIGAGVVDLAEIEAQICQLKSAGRYVVLTFRDTGHGMDAKTQGRIFDPYFTTKGQGKGTGLGLATVYGIVQQHNGNIRVFSQPGRGTEFKIYFPAAVSVQTQSADLASETHDASGTECIMLVEDNDAVRTLAETILASHGYTVKAVNGGQQCLEAITTQPHWDLLLTDVILQDTNGKELYQQVTRRCPHVKVIYMSGYTDDVIVHHGVLEEGIAFIQKPFSVHDLLKKVRGELDRMALQNRGGVGN